MAPAETVVIGPEELQVTVPRAAAAGPLVVVTEGGQSRAEPFTVIRTDPPLASPRW